LPAESYILKFIGGDTPVPVPYSTRYDNIRFYPDDPKYTELEQQAQAKFTKRS
jgi:hypothetical protein